MIGYAKVNLLDISEMAGPEKVSKVISDFYCPRNLDVEDFLKNKALVFSEQRIASTYLIFATYKGRPVLVGYFALTNKHFHIDSRKPGGISKRLLKRISKFAMRDKELNKYVISAPLIGQLSKNYANGYDTLITGDELLKIACDTVREALRIIGGKVVYLECEDAPSLIRFYEENGFYNFGRRILEGDEKHKLKGEYLVQMLRYLGESELCACVPSDTVPITTQNMQGN